MKESPHRRTFLKGVAIASATTAISGINGTSTAKAVETGSKPDEVYQRAVDLREKTGSQDTFKKYLTQNGFTVTSKRYKTSLPSHSDISTESFSTNNLHTDLTLTERQCNPQYIWADNSWSIDINGNDQTGTQPRDINSLYWPDTDYSRIDDTEYTSEHVFVGGKYGDLNGNGIAVEYEDNLDWTENCQKGIMGGYFGLKLLKNDPDRASESRIVNGDYRHTWSGGDITSIGVSAGGLSVGLSWSVHDWRYTYDKGEQFKDEEYCNPI